MRKYSCGFGKLPPFSQWVFDKSRVRLIRHECQEIGRFAQNLKNLIKNLTDLTLQAFLIPPSHPI